MTNVTHDEEMRSSQNGLTTDSRYNLMLMISTKTPAQMFYTVAKWASKDVLPDHTFHKTVMLNDNAPMTYRFINTMIDDRSQQRPVSGCSLLSLHAMDFTHTRRQRKQTNLDMPIVVASFVSTSPSTNIPLDELLDQVLTTHDSWTTLWSPFRARL